MRQAESFPDLIYNIKLTSAGSEHEYDGTQGPCCPVLERAKQTMAPMMLPASRLITPRQVMISTSTINLESTTALRLGFKFIPLGD